MIIQEFAQNLEMWLSPPKKNAFANLSFTFHAAQISGYASWKWGVKQNM